MMAIEDLEDPEVFNDPDMYTLHLKRNNANGADNTLIDMSRKLLAIFYSYMSPVTLNWNDFKKLYNEILTEKKKIITARELMEETDSKSSSTLDEPESVEPTNEPKSVDLEPQATEMKAAVPIIQSASVEIQPNSIENEVHSADAPNTQNVPNVEINFKRGTMVGGGFLGGGGGGGIMQRLGNMFSSSTSSASASSSSSSSSTSMSQVNLYN